MCHVKMNVTSGTLSQETRYSYILLYRHNYNMGLKILLKHRTTLLILLLLLLLLFHSTLSSKSQIQRDSLLKDFLIWYSNNLHLLCHLLSLFAMDSATARVQFAAVRVTAAKSEIKPTFCTEREGERERERKRLNYPFPLESVVLIGGESELVIQHVIILNPEQFCTECYKTPSSFNRIVVNL